MLCRGLKKCYSNENNLLLTLEQLEGRKMSVFEQRADGKMCQVTMATAFEKANLHVQIAASLQYIISLLLLLLYVPLFIAVYST